MSKEHHIIIYIPDEKVYGEIIREGAWASTVQYSKDGILYEVVMLSEDFEIIEDISIDIEEEN
jgi:hypothetical protein